jgi:hypothetical protein
MAANKIRVFEKVIVKIGKQRHALFGTSSQGLKIVRPENGLQIGSSRKKGFLAVP